MKYWKDFFAEIMPECPKVPVPMIVSALRTATIEFCTQTDIWEQAIDSVYISEGTTEYEIEPPDSSSDIVRLTKLTLDGRDLSAGQDYTYNPPNLILSRVPVSSGEIKLRASLKPSRTALGVSDQLFTDWLEVLAAGAKSKLMAIPGKDWSNPSNSVFYEGLFQSGIAKAASRLNKQFTKTGLRVQLRRFC